MAVVHGAHQTARTLAELSGESFRSISFDAQQGNLKVFGTGSIADHFQMPLARVQQHELRKMS